MEELSRIFFSGVESQKMWDNAMDAGARHVLMSIHYLSQKGAQIRKRLEKHPDVRILIDSGAFTFLTNQPKYKDMPLKYWEEYIENYIKWVKEHRDIVFACVELDIDDLVGTEQVNEWRKKYWEPLEAEGIQVCYVWHDIKGTAEWTKMCKKYKYVGMSFAADDRGEIMARKLMLIAQKFKAKVHGFAMTSIDMLTKLPFYTVDSTTWLVGRQYGELNYFDGRRLKRLKKPEWKKMKNKFIKLGIDWDKLKAEDSREMDIAGVKAFLEAEKYVHRRLRMKMYWNKKKKPKESEQPKEFTLIKQTLDDVRFPDLFTWNRIIDLDRYSRELNISPTASDNETVQASIVADCVTFVNMERYEDRIQEVYTDDVLSDITKHYFGTPIRDREEAISRLAEFFTSVVTGMSDHFYTHTFNEDEVGSDDEDEENVAAVRPKEREDYVIDEDMMPEVDIYDKELMAVGDPKPVRGEKGQFAVGHPVRKPKNLYSDKFPKMACDTCYAAQTCPDYRPGAVCAYEKIFKKFDSRDINDIMDQIHSMTNMNAERIMRVAIFEKLDGGMADPNLTNLMNQQMNWLNMLIQLRTRPTMGPQDSVTVNVQGEGILSKIFGVREEPKKADKAEAKDDDIIDGEFEELKDEDLGGDEDD